MRARPLAALVLLWAVPSAATQTFRHRSEVADYLARAGKTYVVRRGDEDGVLKLKRDTAIAIEAFETLKRKKVTFEDGQSFVSWDFYMSQGEARFNPNTGQTRRLQQALLDLFSGGQVTQADLVYEALVATDGNVTYAMGSLAELFNKNRADFIPKVADMDKTVDGKNYYRYAGAFIGLHGPALRRLGEGAAYANIAANPVVYAGGELVEWWVRFVRTGKTGGGVDTLRTLGPEGNGNVVDKGGQLQLGLRAAEQLQRSRGMAP